MITNPDCSLMCFQWEDYQLCLCNKCYGITQTCQGHLEDKCSSLSASLTHTCKHTRMFMNILTLSENRASVQSLMSQKKDICHSAHTGPAVCSFKKCFLTIYSEWYGFLSSYRPLWSGLLFVLHLFVEKLLVKISLVWPSIDIHSIFFPCGCSG